MNKISLSAIGLFFVIAFVVTDASAYYHPAMGRFMQRDPGLGASMRLGTAGPAVVAGFVLRDLLSQYADGMNLYQYARGNPLRYNDPSGLYAGVVDKLTYYSGPLGINIGHEWLSWPGGSVGFWPNRGWVVLRPDPAETKGVPVCWQWDTELKKGFGLLQPKMKWGRAEGKECRCVNEADVINCLESVPDPGWRSSPPFNNCRRFANWALDGCCLKKGKKTTLSCPNNGSGSSGLGS